MPRDPIELEVFKHLFHSIAEEMGASLRRTAFSPNIKERRDYSCAVFDGAGEALAMGDHMPVHLGSMPMSVRAAIAQMTLAPGDVCMLNDPFRGGTHLPDITVVAPVFVGRPRRNAKPDFFVASRAHHADVGGTYAGSMGPCREIYQEGLRIPPVKIVRAGKLDHDLMAMLLNNVRTPEEREGDLSAQLASCHTGEVRLQELCARYSVPRVKRAAHELLAYSEEMMRAFLATVPPGSYSAEDFLDDDGMSDQPVYIAVKITFPRKSGARQRRHCRLHGKCPAGRRQHQCCRSNHLFRVLLRLPLPSTRGRSRNYRLNAARAADRTRRNGGECAASGRRCRRECRNLAAYRRRSFASLGASPAGPHPRRIVGDDEQPDHRRDGFTQRLYHSLRLLRDDRRRLGRQRGQRRCVRRPHAHDEFA